MDIHHLIYYLSCLSCILLELWILFRERKDVEQSKDKNTRIFFALSVAIAILSSFIVARIQHFQIIGSSNTHYIIAVAVIWLGIFFRFWSVITLGKFFRTTVMIHNGHQVIKNGPYKYIRHPAYAADLVILTGIAIGLGSWLSLILMDSLLFYFAIQKRIKLEEKELQSALGNSYINYMQHTKKLIPFIY